RCGDVNHLFWIVPPSADVALASDAMLLCQEAGVFNGFRLIKALLALGYGTRQLGLTVLTEQTRAVVPGERARPAHASVHGLVGSLAKEYPQWQVRLIDLPSHGEWPVARLLSLPPHPQGYVLAYRASQWYRQQLIPCVLPETSSPAFRQGGVYVIVG